MTTSSSPTRRFRPEPYETSAASCRRPPYKVDESVKSTRRFAPEPIETTIRSTRKLSSTGDELAHKTRRRFAPEPIETSTKTNRKQPAGETTTTRRRFDPVPIETSARSNRKDSHKESDEDSSDNSVTTGVGSDRSSTGDSPKQARRKFAPQLIETSKRSRKAGDYGPAVGPADRTEAVPTPHLAIPKHLRKSFGPQPPVNTPTGAAEDNSLDEVMEARRLGKSMPIRSTSRNSNRSHSFRVPELDTIESSESEESNPPSLSTSPSASCDKSYLYKHATRMRESVDERYSGYLLQIAAKAAEKQLQEQAMAAFPNDGHHEPVDHFIDSDDFITRESDRGSSFTQVNWELREMQEFRQGLSRNRLHENRAGKRLEVSSNTSKNPWGNPAAALVKALPQDQGNNGAQKAVRPPMLGNDIAFPRCGSPEPARFDVTQGCHKLKESMCYLSEQCQKMEDQGKEGLWAAKASSARQSQYSQQTCDSVSDTSSKPAGGLWGGCCVAPSTPTRGQSGLMTPTRGIATPIATPCPTPSRFNFPSSGPQDYFSGIHEKLQFEETIDEEFNDAFVTQVYNYLSLGYPSIAKDFDDELSKISRIDTSDLRHDDVLVQNRGYIRFGEDERNAGISEDSCMRWRALRVYIREWAKQQPTMVSGAHALGGFGVAARRGSWAI